VNTDVQDFKLLQEEYPGIDDAEVGHGAGRDCPNDTAKLERHTLRNEACFHRCHICFGTWFEEPDVEPFGRLISGATESRLVKAARQLATTRIERQAPFFDADGLVRWIDGRVDSYFVGVLAIPLAPAGIGLYKLAEDGQLGASVGLTATLATLGFVTLAYLAVWVISRVTGERRFGVGKQRLWLPAMHLGLSGRSVPLDAIRSVERSGAAGRTLHIRFDGGQRVYNSNVVDVEQLEEALRRSVPALRAK
jgi:hypothetical protein